MPDEQRYIPWDDAPLEDQIAYMERLWSRANPEPGSIAYLILQMMSTADMGHGDPDIAELELIARGLYVKDSAHTGHFVGIGEKVLWELHDFG